MGSRVPDEVQVKLKEMFQMNVAIPSLTHYVEWVDLGLGVGYLLTLTGS